MFQYLCLNIKFLCCANILFQSFCCPECAGPVCKVERKFQCKACQCDGVNIQQLSVTAEKANHLFSQSLLLLQQQDYKGIIKKKVKILGFFAE